MTPGKFRWSSASTLELPSSMDGEELERLGLQPERDDTWETAKQGLAKHESFKVNPEAFAWSSVPHGGIAAKWGTNKKTKCQPFSFHERDQITQEKKAARIKMIIEEEKNKAQFQARPLPEFYGGSTDSKKDKFRSRRSEPDPGLVGTPGRRKVLKALGPGRDGKLGYYY